VYEVFSVNARNYWRVLIGWLGTGELWVSKDALMGFRATRPIRHVFYYVISPLLGYEDKSTWSRYPIRVIYEALQIEEKLFCETGINTV
jgi:hypothetical protein